MMLYVLYCLNVRMPLGQQQVPQEPWYTSGTAWTIVGIVVAVMLGSWAVWAAFRSARPRRTLHIWVESLVPLVNTAPGLHGRQLTVALDGHKLRSPYVVEVEMASRGALDISAAAFGGQPLELDFSVPIVALLKQSVDAGRPAVREPRVEVVDTALHVGPALLTRRHRLRYTVLLNGKPDFHPVGDLENVIIRDSKLAYPLPKFLIAISASFPLMVTGVALLTEGALEGNISWLALILVVSALAITAPLAVIDLRQKRLDDRHEQ
ncbi:hypothetical protein AB0K14_02145 [Actinosynnema sp. NPDC050801]|uniref:hypothetical protein n=1 Tax=unclassified Actinosynnema TaxID=2637065 RepID=UPI0033D2B5B6